MATKPPTLNTTTPNPHIPPPTKQEHRRRAILVAQWTRNHGNTCPGHNCPQHQVTHPNYLTADHTTPRRHAGENGPLTILCMTCNGRRKYNEQP